MFNFWGTAIVFFHSGCCSPFSQWCTRFNFSASSETLVIFFSKKIIAILIGMEWYPLVVLVCVPWWLVMLVSFCYYYWSVVYILWRNVCFFKSRSFFCIMLFVILSSLYSGSSDVWFCSYYHSWFVCILLIMSFNAELFFNFDEVQLTCFSAPAFVSYQEITAPKLVSWNFYPVFFP